MMEREQKMPRKKIETETLEDLVPLYGWKNSECNALKKLVAELNDKVKTAIKAVKQENKDIIIDGWKCSLTVSEVDKMNEDKLLEVCHTFNIPVIKQKEYVDFDELERLMYSNKIDQEAVLAMDACNEKSARETLRCTKVKE